MAYVDYLREGHNAGALAFEKGIMRPVDDPSIDWESLSKVPGNGALWFLKGFTNAVNKGRMLEGYSRAIREGKAERGIA
jgi:hypothetical protein